MGRVADLQQENDDLQQRPDQTADAGPPPAPIEPPNPAPPPPDPAPPPPPPAEQAQAPSPVVPILPIPVPQAHANDDILRLLIAAQQAATAAQIEANRQAQAEKAATTFPKLKDFTDVPTWYQKLVTVTSQPRFSSFYDPLSEDKVISGAPFPALNSALCTEILNNSGKPVEKYILAKTHLRNDGIVLLWEMNATFNRKWSILKTKDKKKEWDSMKMIQNETFEDFYTRCLQLRKELITNNVICSELDLRHAFIMGLSAHFTSVQEKLDSLPDEWRTCDIHMLPKTAHDFYESKMSVRNLHREHRPQT